MQANSRIDSFCVTTFAVFIFYAFCRCLGCHSCPICYRNRTVFSNIRSTVSCLKQSTSIDYYATASAVTKILASQRNCTTTISASFISFQKNSYVPIIATEINSRPFGWIQNQVFIYFRFSVETDRKPTCKITLVGL